MIIQLNEPTFIRQKYKQDPFNKLLKKKQDNGEIVEAARIMSLRHSGSSVSFTAPFQIQKNFFKSTRSHERFDFAF